jgi:hypothetical protein
MPKKTKAAKAGNGDLWITAKVFSLTVKNSDTDFVFDLNVNDENGGQYQLRTLDLNEANGLVQRTLQTIANRWPDYDWQFQADASGKITNSRSNT